VLKESQEAGLEGLKAQWSYSLQDGGIAISSTPRIKWVRVIGSEQYIQEWTIFLERRTQIKLKESCGSNELGLE
jgi:hypothetical protein